MAGENGAATIPKLDVRRWDTDTATAALVFAALGFLFLVRRGFRGVVVNLGS